MTSSDPSGGERLEDKKTLLRPTGWPAEMGDLGEEVVDRGDTNNPPPAETKRRPVVVGEGEGAENDGMSEQRVVLNVGGVRHETRVSTLRNIPNTRLSRLAISHSQMTLPASTPSPLLTTPTLSPTVTPIAALLPPTEYFFDRHPAVFNAIIDFYRTGELHVPLEVCGAVVKRELDFWQIDEMEIKACCWRHYRSYIENQAILDSFNNSLIRENQNIDIGHLKGWDKFQMQVWLILDHPRTSKTAMAYGIISFLFVVTSIAGFCLETLPNLRPDVQHNVTTTCNGVEQVIDTVMTSNEALNVLDIICTVFFSLELVMRFTFSPSKFKFIFSPMNIIDLLALVPLYVTVIFTAWNLQACYLNEQFVIEIMFILRIFRMFRIFHLVKHYQALKVLVYALRASLQELLMLFIFLLIAMLIFATMIYYAERQDATKPSEQFNTIPMGFWWAIITMTTVGYGDVSPVTPVGYIVGTACCVVGVLLVALTFPVISNNFTLFYTHVRSRSVKQPPSRILEVDGEEGTSGGNEDSGMGGGGGGKSGGLTVGMGVGGSSTGRGGGGGGCSRDEEEEHLLRSPLNSPHHGLEGGVARKGSSGSAVTEPYMNGGTFNPLPPSASPGVGGPRSRHHHHQLPTPVLAKFSDSTSMTDIVLSRGRRSPSDSNDSGSVQRQQRQRQYSVGTPRAGSVSSRHTHSDDGRGYHGETKL